MINPNATEKFEKACIIVIPEKEYGTKGCPVFISADSSETKIYNTQISAEYTKAKILLWSYDNMLNPLCTPYVISLA